MLEDNFSSGFIICTWSSLIIDIKLTLITKKNAFALMYASPETLQAL